MMLLSIAAGIGLQRKIREKIAIFNGHIEISNFDNNASKVSIRPISKNQTFYPEFKEIAEITHIQPIATKAGIIRTETNFEAIIVKGVDHTYDWKGFNDFLVEGRLPNFSQKKINEEIIISKYIANRLFLKVGENAVTYFLKDEIRYNLRNFKIVGIYDSGFEDFDKNIALVDLRHIQRLNKWKKDEVGAFEVFIDDFKKIEELNNAVYTAIPSELESTAITQKFPAIFQWIKMFDFNIVGIIGIMIIVAIINMITAILVLILERTSLIGMLKALGSANKSIRKIFLYNAGYIILKGLLWGNFIGLGVIAIQYFFKPITLNPEHYYVKAAPVFISLHHILLLNIGTLVTCVVVLWLPSVIITKISPIKAIRFQ